MRPAIRNKCHHADDPQRPEIGDHCCVLGMHHRTETRGRRWQLHGRLLWTGEKPIPIQPNCPSIICDAGFFDNRYANTTTLIFHKSEKLGKGLDLGFHDNN